MKREEAVKLHKEMWGWLAENPDKDKPQWPRWVSNGGTVEDIDYDCFACEDNSDYTGTYSCKNCMIDWGYNNCKSIGSPYELWDYSENNEDKAIYAAIIRDLPIRKL